MRTFSPYELNQLSAHDIPVEFALTKGEMPVEYITGHVPFSGHDFLVNQDVLIPRVETEELVAQAVVLAQELHAQHQAGPLSVADIGTGCGAIGISFCLALEKLGIPYAATLSDVSAAAIAVGKENSRRLLKHQPTILVSDLLAAFPSTSRFHLFFANLPYIPTQRIPALDDSVTKFEPHLALDGGPEGLSLIESFLNQAEAHLEPEGLMLLEMDYTHAEDILRLNSRFEGRIVRDTFGQQRFAVFQLKK